jgi:hypothetical protein
MTRAGRARTSRQERSRTRRHAVHVALMVDQRRGCTNRSHTSSKELSNT